MKPEFEIGIFTGRKSKKYQNLLARLLSKENLIRDAEIIKEGEERYGEYKKRISIKFCGLSGMSILGGTESFDGSRLKSVDSFIDLVSNKDGIVEELNLLGIHVDIKIIFAYPYSDFMFDLIQAETNNQNGFSSKCVLKGEKVGIDFRLAGKLSYEDLSGAPTFKNLCNSLDKLQQAVISSNLLFNSKSPNRAVVKLTPLSILSCFLKINHHIFVDPYIYSKDDKGSPMLNLLAPISHIKIPGLPSEAEVKAKGFPEKDKSILNHYCSLISHFRYLWQHPLTMYSTDATKYDKGNSQTLSKIKKPLEVSYQAKAKRITDFTKRNEAIADLWKQECRAELLRYCSKFDELPTEHNTKPDIERLEPLPIFIAGLWERDTAGNTNGPSNFMHELSDRIEQFFMNPVDKGLLLSPRIVDADNGVVIQDSVFEALNAAQLGIIILTSDIEEGENKPNIYFERGYLMGKLTKRKSRASNELKDLVFVYMQKKVKSGTDVENIGVTSFISIEDFRLQFFRFVKWLWDVTELNSEYAIEIITDYKKLLRDKMDAEPDEKLYGNLHRKAVKYIREIRDWETRYDKRMERLNNK